MRLWSPRWAPKTGCCARSLSPMAKKPESDERWDGHWVGASGASIGVQLANPNRQVVSLQGDGGFLFGQSDAMWTMSRYDVPVITVIANNHSYDEPRNQMQARGGRAAQEDKDMICYLGSPNVDFTHIGQAYGIRGERILNPDQLEPAIGRAIRTAREGRPYILDVEVARTGLLADSTWHPAYSVAGAREERG